METCTDEDLFAVLGVRPGADADALRAAYLVKIRDHPPERDPEMFGRVRDAYRTLSDPKRKMASYFDDAVLDRPLRNLIAESDDAGKRRPLGVAAWLELLHHVERQGRRNPGERP